jgi:acyl-CoA synthetase (AMP-forming)/AMP-acid ligase II
VSDPVRDNLGYFFDEAARRAPDHTALIDLWGERERVISYRALDDRTERAGAVLQSLGLKPGDRLALLVGNRSEYLEIFFGAMRAGVVPVPLNVKQTRDALDFMVRDAGCVGAAVDPEAVRGGFDLVESIGLRTRIAVGAAPEGWVDYEPALAAAPSSCAPALSPDGIAFQPYTAGSTGRPKGVRLTHRGMLWSIRSTQENWPMDSAEIGLVAVPLFHKNAMRGVIKPALHAGAAVVLMPRFEPRAFLDALARYRVTFSGGVPAIFTLLLQHRDLLERLDFSAFHMVAIGSAVVPQEMVDALERVFPNLKVKESYGLTEGGGPLRAPTDGRPVPRGSCGIATEGYEVKLVAPDGREGVKEGELWTRNPCVTEGYHNLPEVTRAKIVDGWLRTGDVFRVDEDGFFYFMGRVDDMFSCGGENIYPKEVENLLFSHPAVRDACVVPIPHRVKGFVPAAAVALKEGAETTPEELKAFCLERGPAYAHPRRVVILDDLPLSGAGKLDRKAVQRQLSALPGTEM